MYRLRVYVAAGEELLRKKIKLVLLKNGYQIVGEAEDGPTALRVLRTIACDLFILDNDLSGVNGLEVARIVEEEKIAPILLITSQRQGEVMEKAKGLWIFGFLVKPFTENGLLASIDSVMLTYGRMQALEKEVHKLKTTLETRKLVEKAKGLLMQNLGITEAQAFRRIQQQSMDKGKPMKDIAEAIVLAYELQSEKKRP